MLRLIQQLLHGNAFAEAEFIQCLGQFLIVRRLAVPSSLILHEADALALDRIGKDDDRFPHNKFRQAERVYHLLHVVAIDTQNIPAETGVLCRQRFDLHHVLYPAINLQTIAVDDADKVVEVEVSRFHRSFPDLSFLLFAVAHQAERLVPLAVEFGCQRYTYGDAQALSQRTRRDLDPRQLEPMRVTLVSGAEFAQRHHVLDRTEARDRQSEIQAGSLVSS